MGAAYLFTGRHEEAIATLKECLSRKPSHPYAHANLAIVYSELGREDEARAEAEEFLRTNPNFSLEFMRQSLFFKDPAVLERIITGLRKAGLK